MALQGLVIGQTSQPTGLGFLVLAAGLMLAACNPTRLMRLQQQYAVPFPEPHYGHA
jgi:hypothetical protein